MLDQDTSYRITPLPLQYIYNIHRNASDVDGQDDDDQDDQEDDHHTGFPRCHCLTYTLYIAMMMMIMIHRYIAMLMMLVMLIRMMVRFRKRRMF